MAAMLQRDEWKAFSDFLALGAAGILVVIGAILAIGGEDPAMAFHGCLLFGAAGLAFLYILTQVIEKKEAHDTTTLIVRYSSQKWFYREGFVAGNCSTKS